MTQVVTVRDEPCGQLSVDLVLPTIVTLEQGPFLSVGLNEVTLNVQQAINLTTVTTALQTIEIVNKQVSLVSIGVQGPVGAVGATGSVGPPGPTGPPGPVYSSAEIQAAAAASAVLALSGDQVDLLTVYMLNT